ncbi:MAG: hypothetical protein SGJ11_00865 [Phycisphaerae bacterium]|nr:hypothetical protein [Phycisphaerae bacterium]
MRIAAAAAWGTLFGLLAAVGWALLTYYSGFLVGFVAWGIGWAAGRGVYLGMKESAGAHSGILAVVIGVLCYLVANAFLLVIAAMEGTPLVNVWARFTAQFGPLDLLWIAFVIWPAYRVGATGNDL